ncbi:hypothetical protein CDV31_006305 [Fusarium ambrosium]|uniref:S-adenosylmethionine mitochondrial carrier protein n=1 Tax=Fusarium ambrosium TaxID=131363 RepID=A0A428UDV1_9HYPO|nr:hypothetical protein CDV31_006305 [Fusarium ambrosium]
MSIGTGAEVWSAAVVAGLSADLFVHPMETIITRIQSPFYTIRYKSNGRIQQSLFRGLYQGFGPTLITGIPSSAAFFIIYESMKSTFQESKGFLQYVPPSAVHVASSGAAELVNCAISNPAEVLKQNAQIQLGGPRKPWGWYTVQAVRHFSAHPTRLWTGYSALLASHLPGTCLTFGIYEHIKAQILGKIGETNPQSAASMSMQVQVSTLSAGLAGGFTSCFLVPIDVIKTRMRLAAGGHGVETPERSRRPAAVSFLNIAKETLHTDGMPGLFRGFTLTCVAATVGSGVYLGCYEGVKLYIKDLGESQVGD